MLTHFDDYSPKVTDKRSMIIERRSKASDESSMIIERRSKASDES